MNIALIGSKASGKATQIAKLRQNQNIMCFSPGEEFHNAARKDTPLGQLVRRYLGTKELIPDAIVNDLIHEWLWTTAPVHNIVFDGYPRTLAQASFLESALKDMGRRLDAIIYLEVSTAAVIERLSGRRICRMCKDEFHLVSHPFRSCIYSRCKGQYLKSLKEDSPENITALMDSFYESIASICAVYDRDKRLIRINGEQDIDQIHGELLRKLEMLEDNP